MMPISWFICNDFLDSYPLGPCILNFGPIVFERFGWIENVIDDGKEKMIKLFSSQPKWSDYNLGNEMTQNVFKYWMDFQNGGGQVEKSILDEISTQTVVNGKKIIKKRKTPLRTLMEQSTTYGYYHINKL